MSWKIKKNLQEKCKKEQFIGTGWQEKSNKFAILYPNTYFLAMSNLGWQVIYKIINESQNFTCERFFLPDTELMKEYISSNVQLMSLETQRPLADFDIIGFSLSFEMDYFNIPKMLCLGNINSWAKERHERDPLVIAGGICATCNPEPVADFFDAFVVGEGEDVIKEILDCVAFTKKKLMNKSAVLQELAKIKGLYLPHLTCSGFVSFSKTEKRIVRQKINTPASTAILTEDTEFSKMFMIEVSRGCGRSCRFCMAGYAYRPPVSYQVEDILKIIEKSPGESRIGLLGAAVSDFKEIGLLCKKIKEMGKQVSVSSLRADSINKDLLTILYDSGYRTLTIAPEAGSEKLRKVINKKITEENLLSAVKMALAVGFRKIKMYFMVGLPQETDEDIDEIVFLIEKILCIGKEKKVSGYRVMVSINPFIPKPWTPFERLSMIEKDEYKKKINILRKNLKKNKNVVIIAEEENKAYIQGILARGSREMARMIFLASQNGGYKAFKKILKDWPELVRKTDFLEESDLPWKKNIDLGISEEFIVNECKSALELKETSVCKNEHSCKICGVCK